MKGRLFVLEGATASGKDTLLKRLEGEGYTMIRGVASQNSQENQSLTLRSQEILGGINLDFKRTLTLPAQERDDIFRRFIKIGAEQQDEAIRLKNNGQTVFINRSVLSVIALLTLPSHIVPEDKKEKMKEWGKSLISECTSMKQRFEDEVDGLILMRKAAVGGLEREGMSGVQDLEAGLISDEVEKLAETNKLPVLELDANNTSIEEEVVKVKEFLLTTR